ncbi:hypothetical protein LCGC14_0632100 [marine sediment metagenome]|uniref:Uncharacterized protein n=1 Tax=marine sediment metagenome TaxID=412755 RepID=A0A0F9R1J7_9ZZZZ
MVMQSRVGPDGQPEIVIPQKGLLDYLSRADDLLIQNLQALRALTELTARTSQRGPSGPGGFGSIEFKQKLINSDYKPYEVKSYPLDVARADERILVDGQALQAWTDGSLDGCSVKLNNKNESDAIAFDNFNPIIGLPFHVLYLTTPVQTGRTLRLLIAKEPYANMSPAQLETSLVQRFWPLTSDKDIHFTGAIATNAIEAENLTGLVSSEIRITGVVVQSKQALDYRLVLFNKDTMEDTDLDVDAIISEIEVDMASYSFRIAGANQYYMIINGLSVDYEDLDETREIHVALQNLSAASKNAGATGEVTVKFLYEERE